MDRILETVQRPDGARGESSGARRVTVFVGSPQKHGATDAAAQAFARHLEARGGAEVEVVHLTDYDIAVCRGCKLCFDLGEDRCPLKDDRDVLLQKMDASDGVVFATPNYMFQVSAVMKILLDRLAFMGHRPRYHGKTFTAIVVEGIGMGGRIVKYLTFIAGPLGFTTVKGSCSKTLKPMTEAAIQKMDRKLLAHSRRFHAQLMKPAHPVPSLLGLALFRMARSGIRRYAAKDKRDFGYYRERGWFESEYYYPTHLGPIKSALGALFDWVGAHASIFAVAE